MIDNALCKICTYGSPSCVLLWIEITGTSSCLQFSLYQVLYHRQTTDWPLCWKTPTADKVNNVNDVHTDKCMVSFLPCSISLFVYWNKKKQTSQTFGSKLRTDRLNTLEQKLNSIFQTGIILIPDVGVLYLNNRKIIYIFDLYLIRCSLCI